jgi:hypothetical protein
MRCVIQRANLLLNKSGVSRSLYRVARISMSADGIENGYKETVVAKARAWIACSQARIKMHVTSQGDKASCQYTQIDGDDGQNAQVRGPHLCVTARNKISARANVEECVNNFALLRRTNTPQPNAYLVINSNTCSVINLTHPRRRRPTRKIQHAETSLSTTECQKTAQQ